LRKVPVTWEIPCKIVSVEKGSCYMGDPFRHIDMEDVPVTTEKLKHAVKGFDDTHKEYDQNETISGF